MKTNNVISILLLGLLPWNANAYSKKFEAENMLLKGVMIRNDLNPVAVDYDDNANSWISWEANLPSAGTYEAEVHYIAGDNIRQMKLFKDSCCSNPNKLANYNIKGAKDWKTYQSETKQFFIGVSGLTKFYLASVGKGPIVDYVILRSGDGSKGGGTYVNTCETGDNWCIARYGAVMTTFEDGNKDEVSMMYLVSDHIDADAVTYEVMAMDCEHAATGIADGSLSFINNYPEDPPPDMKFMELTLDFDEDTIYDSNIWTEVQDSDGTEGHITICVRTEIWWYPAEDYTRGRRRLVDVVANDEDSVSVSMVQTVIDFYVKLSSDLSITQLGAVEVLDEVTSSNANIQYPVTACFCDSKNVCVQNSSPATINSDISTCIWSDSAEVEIQEVTKFRLEQDQGDGEMYLVRAIDEVTKTPTPLTKVSYKKHPTLGMGARVTTRAITRFFEKVDPEDLRITGEVSLKFVDTGGDRRRQLQLRGLQDGEATADGNSTPLMGAFDLSLALCTEDCDDDADGMAGTTIGYITPLVVGAVPLMGLLA